MTKYRLGVKGSACKSPGFFGSPLEIIPPLCVNLRSCVLLCIFIFFFFFSDNIAPLPFLSSSNPMNNKSFIRMAGFSLLLVFVVCASLVRASSEPLERRGIARLMSFNNATDANLVKRGGRGTWYMSITFHKMNNTTYTDLKRYTGADLKNAACYDRNGLDPFSASPHDFIGAMVNYTHLSPRLERLS